MNILPAGYYEDINAQAGVSLWASTWTEAF